MRCKNQILAGVLIFCCCTLGWQLAFAETPELLQFGSRLGTAILPDPSIGGISGTWSWRWPETEPEVGTREYEAVFTPSDIENYASVSAMIPVMTIPATPTVSDAHATVKSGTKLSEITEITYTASGVKGEPLTGRFQLSDTQEDIILSEADTGHYPFLFLPENPNYTSTETKASIAVTGSASPSGGSSGGRPAVPGYTVAYELGAEGSLVTGSRAERVKEGMYPVRVPVVKAEPDTVFLGWSLDGETLVQPETVRIYEDTVFTAVYQPANGNQQHTAYLQGYEDGSFRPNAEITRAETAAVIAKVSSRYDPAQAYSTSYTDVSESEWSASYVGFAEQQGLVTGYEDGTFRPEAPITRAEFAVMIARYLNLSPSEYTGFADTQEHWADGAISALAAIGMISGYEDGLFRPGQAITRAEAVKVINTILGRNTICSGVHDNPFVDLTQDHWAYNDILEASTTHKARTAKSALSALTD